jgi:adenylyltransferase/sulfurtransferase
MTLSNYELEKYSRHFLIEGFSEDHQIKLKEARSLVIGAGGLGSPVLLYLAGAGLGTIGIVDNDIVTISNLPRQVLYSQEDVGKPKALLAKLKIHQYNPECKVTLYQQRWNEENAEQIASEYDLIIDCTDNIQSRYVTDSVSKKYNLPFVFGAVHQMEGQVAVFNYKGSKSYSDFFSEKNLPETDYPQGVLGPAAGIIGNLQASEAIKIITGIGEVLANKMLFISLRFNRYKIFNF